MILAVKDATGATQNIPFPNGNGQAPMAGSAPVVIASGQILLVSASVLPLPTGAAADGNDGSGIAPPTGGSGIRGWLSGIYSKLSNPLSVNGTFWQAIQPVSVASMPALPSGTNSIGAVTNSAFGISGTLPAFAAPPTMNIGTAPSLAVTGTFFQGTQPVSIAAMPTTAVTGTFWQAIQPVSLPSLPPGTNLIGTVLGPLPAIPITGQQILTTAAVALPANALQNGLIVTALSANTGTVYVGAAGVTATTGYPLSAGQSMSFAVANASGISIIGSNATDKVAYSGN